MLKSNYKLHFKMIIIRLIITFEKVYSRSIMINKKEAKKEAIKTKPLQNGTLQGLSVVPPGIEPGTHGFSVRCSTI